MAIGDAAAAAGMALVDGATTDANTIDTELNRTRDYIAQKTGLIPIAQGGTGATTVAQAQKNLQLEKATTLSNTKGKIVPYGDTGTIAVSPPTSNVHATPKAYVDAQFTALLERLTEALTDLDGALQRIAALEARIPPDQD